MKAQLIPYPVAIVSTIRWHLDPANETRFAMPEWALKTLESCVRNGVVSERDALEIRLEASVPQRLDIEVDDRGPARQGALL